MGKGKSSAGIGGNVVTKVTTQSGVVIDISKTPLVYGNNDPAISGTARANVKAFEQKRVKMKTEYALMLDSQGNQVGNEVKGGRTSCRIPNNLFKKGGVMSHNHPRGKGEEGELGGTFSVADIGTFSKSQLNTIRATAAEGTYSLTRSLGFDGMGLNYYMKSIDSKNDAVFKTTQRQLKQDYYANKIDGRTFNRRQKIAFNQYLISMHNDLLAGQAKYGYTYTLEK